MILLSKQSDTDGIISLIAADVRAIGTVKTTIEGSDATLHAVDIVYDPIPDNPAHSQIVVTPEFYGSNNKRKNIFKLLQFALAKLAEKNGWTLRPNIE